MRALITGAAGFVGSHLAEYLVASTAWDLVAMTRWSDPLDNLRNIIPLANRNERVRFVTADLRDPWAVRSAVREAAPDYIFHLGAQSFPLTSFSSPNDTLETNVQGTVNVLESVRELAPDAWVHVCSSSEVYGRVSADRLPITEDCPFAPASPYSISKVAADLLGTLYAEAHGLKTIVTRMFTHTGPRRGDVFAESSFAKQIAMIEAGQIAPVVRVGNLDSLRTVADVRDAVRAYHMALTVDPVPGAVYNIGGAHTCTVGHILEALFGIAGCRYPVEIDPARLRPRDADLQVPDCGRFTARTGWRPRIAFKDTMADLLEYWRLAVRARPYLAR